MQNHFSSNVDAKKSSGGLNVKVMRGRKIQQEKKSITPRREDNTAEKHPLIGRKRTICGTHAMRGRQEEESAGIGKKIRMAQGKS